MKAKTLLVFHLSLTRLEGHAVEHQIIHYTTFFAFSMKKKKFAKIICMANGLSSFSSFLQCKNQVDSISGCREEYVSRSSSI